MTDEDGHIELELPGASVRFTSRRGGVSEPPFDTLNLGRFTEDDPEAVAENYRRLGRPVAHGRQVHGRHVERRTTEGAGGDADGQATAQPGLAPLVLVADCLPIALAGDGAVAVLHGGWRGLARGIVAEGVRAVRELGGDGPLTAAIGPGAGRCCYEVGEEVHAAFARHGDAVRGPGRNLDLKAVARIELEEAGVREVTDVEVCTICGDPTRWFSHRREHGRTGRQAGLVWRTS